MQNGKVVDFELCALTIYTFMKCSLKCINDTDEWSNPMPRNVKVYFMNNLLMNVSPRKPAVYIYGK